MKKTFLVFTLLLIAGLVFAQTTINFDDAAKWTAGSAQLTGYAVDHVYTDGVFSATGGLALRETSGTQDGFPKVHGTYAWRLQTHAEVDWRITIASGGVSNFSLDIRRWDGEPSPDYNLEYSTDGGTAWIFVSLINNTTLNDTSDWSTFQGVINSDNNNIIIRIKANSKGERIMVDNFEWTGYSGSTPTTATPVITPDSGVSYEPINVEITCSTDGFSIYYTTDGTDPDNSSDEYNEPLNITSTTTLKAIAYAPDHEPSLIAEGSYTILEPAYTAIPFYESFDTDLGDLYVYSVSGDTRTWTWNSYGYAYMNGHDTGDLEEDWLILPGIDFSAYDNLEMSFNTWYRYGSDDDDNFLKLKYSTNYPGYGDPTPYSWTEIPFNIASSEQTWASSGILDLAGISGSSVWLGFQYHYDVGSYRSWEIDNISIEEVSADPVIYVTGTLANFTYEFGTGPSAEQSFKVAGDNLIDNIDISAPDNYEIALVSGGPFSSSIELTENDGVVEDTDIYVRLKAGLAIGTYNGEIIEISSDDADSKTVTCNGEVTAPVHEPEDLIHYWNFNDDTPVDDSTNWDQPIDAKIGTGELKYYDISEAYSYGGTTINGIDDEENGGSFSPRSGPDNENNGKHFDLIAPTTGYENIVLSYATRGTSTGFKTQTIYYSIDGGTNYTSFTEIPGRNVTSWSVQTIDFSSVIGANDNPNFVIRIVLDGATGATGNNRFDNIRIMGDDLGGGDPPVPVELSSFTATISAQNYITLTWVTQTETGLRGYYVFRAPANDLASAQIVSPMIASMNSSEQQSYVYEDRELYESGTYYYWLQANDLDGSSA
ncbi:MAG: chitobiase/beta-hexosaminidase C-terminal domain-containing protein, partial [Candidatus Cloacimonadaceae bacterium]|nr:chitobiase/beta-hexosaminidase C-terminal domain-containing protein [Candidatus Cloacimonadota bacterium]